MKQIEVRLIQFNTKIVAGVSANIPPQGHRKLLLKEKKKKKGKKKWGSKKRNRAMPQWWLKPESHN